MKEESSMDPNVKEIMRKVRREAQRRKGHEQLHDKDAALNHVNKLSFEPKRRYKITDFTAYSDEAFIHNLYKGVLKRDADPEGLKSYLKLLRSGEHSKIEILVDIRFSEEGRSKNVKIVGVNKHHVLSILYRLPRLGSLIKMLVTLPQRAKRSKHYENSITAQSGPAPVQTSRDVSQKTAPYTSSKKSASSILTTAEKVKKKTTHDLPYILRHKR